MGRIEYEAAAMAAVGGRIEYKEDEAPTWREVLPWLVELAANGGKEETRERAMKELLRLADIVDGMAREGRKKVVGWEVYGKEGHLDDVFFQEGMGEEEVRVSLVQHDGFPEDIRVVRKEME